MIALRERGDEIAHGEAQENLHDADGEAEPEQGREPETRLPLRASIEEGLGEDEEFLQQRQVGLFGGGNHGKLDAGGVALATQIGSVPVMTLPAVGKRVRRD